MSRVLVVDDEPGLRRFLELMLTGEGLDVDTAPDGEQALLAFDPARHDVVLHDLKMPGALDGLGLLRQLKQRDPDATAIVMTAFGTWETAVEAMRLGAFDYVTKPFDNDQIKAMIQRALQRREALRRPREALPFQPLVGNSAALQAVFELIDRVATTDATVLISGESGTGKELVARSLHLSSQRRDRAFLSVNCGALPETLLESELFGHAKGAFTGAHADKPGLFQLADGGTLFLDEVGEMGHDVQVKFLRALETREVFPVGGTRPRPVDVRFVAATNRDLAAEVTARAFREDLYYRLNVIPIQLPPLRERRDDIPLLVGHFLSIYNAKMGRGVEGLTDAALRAMLDHDWPGNVRELENTIQRAVALSQSEQVDVDAIRLGGAPASPTPAHAPPLARPASAALPDELPEDLPEEGFDLEQHLADVERALIERALEKTDGNVTHAAKLLGMSFRQLRYRVKKLGIQRG